MNDFSYSKGGLHLTEQFEGCRLQSYQDVKGVWTIGYGHTHGVVFGQIITQEDAEDMLRSDIEASAQAVKRFVSTPLSQDEFDALVDFTFNLGSGALSGSTMLRDLNAGHYSAAAAEFERWDRAGGVVVAGLLRRREEEERIFLGGA